MNTFNHYIKKVKIYPNKNQKEVFDFWLRRCKILYNVSLEEKIEYYRKTGKYLNVYEQKKELVDIKDLDYSWKDIPNKSLQEIIFRIDKSFKSFFKGNGFPKFRNEINSIEFVKTDIRLKNNSLYLPKIKEEIKYKEEIKADWSSVRLIKDGNSFFLSFLYKEEFNIDINNGEILGIDLGLDSLYTDSTGNKCKRFSLRLIKSYRNRINDINKSLSSKKRGSKRYKKTKYNLNKAYKRLKRTKDDYLHKESLKLVRDSKESIIALGDINVNSIINNNKETKSKKGLIKSFYVNSLSIFKQFIIYKSLRYNKLCLLVDERNTSKTCSCCGNIKYDLSLKDRIYNCKSCNNSIDRDENSAINMKLLGSSLISKDICVL